MVLGAVRPVGKSSGIHRCRVTLGRFVCTVATTLLAWVPHR